jgi:SAM-dependent methyltransferase
MARGSAFLIRNHMNLLRSRKSARCGGRRTKRRKEWASTGIWDRLFGYMHARKNPLTLTLISLRKRGLIRTLNRVITIATDIGFDLRHGTDTLRCNFNMNALIFDSDHKERTPGYQATEATTLRKLMRILNLPKNGVFVDLGSGKGRVLLVAAQCEFKRTVGVEFSPQLCEVARENVKIFKRKTRTDAEIEVVEADVTRYAIEPEADVFYMYNPFDEVVMTQFLAALHRSLTQFPRKIWLIYNLPRQADTVGKSGLFCSCQEYKINENTFWVYANTEREGPNLQTIARRTSRQADVQRL